MPQWQKPENALRRANELLEVGKKQDALDTLHDVIKARKHRQWTKIHELIMTKHLELCVELRKPHLAKDGLFQYRNMCQQVNVKSLEDVIGSFLDMAEKKADQAREESHGSVEDIEDLDQAESPEKLLLSAVSGEGAQDRADRTVLSPWLRFLWESYRQCLELLRNNVQVETLYHKVAKQAFQFCLKYQRKAEFRKLCDNLRTHLNQIQKSQHAHFALKLSNPETLAMHQDTRLIQLDVAIQMELWQEAFKSAEDVHSLMQLSKRQAKASTLASYYEKLALIFWKAGNVLYHAAALMKLFQLTKELKKTVSVDESTHLATRTLLATLSIQWTGVGSDLSRHLEMEETQIDNQRKLASLIMMPAPPSRISLMKDVTRLNVTNMSQPAAQQLYNWLEVKFDPLKLAAEIENQLKSLSDLGKVEYVQYVDSLKQVTALKVLKQVSQVYQTVTFKFLLKIIPFFDIAQMERLIVAAGKKAQMQVRLHHRTESVEFGVAEGLSFGGEEEEASSLLASAQLNVPIVQTMPNEQIRQHLQQMYAALQEAVDSVDSDAGKLVMEQLRNQITFYNYHAADQHKRTLERKKRIELYKEVAEKIRSEQEEKEKEHEKQVTEQKLRETTQRLEQEKVDRLERQKREQEESMKLRIINDRLARLNDPKLKELIGKMADDEIQNMDAETLLQKQISHLEQEKKEQLAKLKQQEKKWDYFVRAMHSEEIPLREEEYKTWAVEDRQMWDEYETNRIKKAIEDHRFMIDSYNRLQRMEKDAEEVVESIRKARANDFKQRVVDWEKKLKDVREKRLKERREERKAKRRAEWLEQKKEEDKRKREEEEKQKREQENKRNTDGGNRFGNRRPMDENRDGGGEPSGADADKWVRAGPMQQSTDRGGRVNVGPRPTEGGAKPAWGASAGAKAEEDRDWRAGRPGPLDAGQGFRRPPPSDGDAEPAPREVRAEPDWTKREGPLVPLERPGQRPPMGRDENEGPEDRPRYDDRRGFDEPRRSYEPRQRPDERSRYGDGNEPAWGRRQGPLEGAVQAERSEALDSMERRAPYEDRRPAPYDRRYGGDDRGEPDWRRKQGPLDDERRGPPTDRQRPPMDRDYGRRPEPQPGADQYGRPREREMDWRAGARQGPLDGGPGAQSFRRPPPSDGHAEPPPRAEPNWTKREGPLVPVERPGQRPPMGRDENDGPEERPRYDDRRGFDEPRRSYEQRQRPDERTRYGEGNEPAWGRRQGPLEGAVQAERIPEAVGRAPYDDRRPAPYDRRYGGDDRGETDWRRKQGPIDDDRRGPPDDRRGPPDDRRGPPDDRRGPPPDRDDRRGPPMDRDDRRGPPPDRSRPQMDRNDYGRRQEPPPADQYGGRPRGRDEPRHVDNRDQPQEEEEGWARVPPKRRF